MTTVLRPDRPISQQPLESKGSIIVGDDAWISFGAIILGGVRIGQGAVVGAGSVVTRSIPDGAVAHRKPGQGGEDEGSGFIRKPRIGWLKGTVPTLLERI